MNTNEEKESLQQVAEQLKGGGVILCPTDTIYGLSCDATNKEAIEKIRNIKGRDQEKPFIVLVNSERLFNQCTGEVPAVAWDLIDNADSPLTLVLPASNFLPEVLRPNQMVGIRFVKDLYIDRLISKLNRPMVSTSANLSGEASASEFSEINEKIIEQVDYVVPEEFDTSERNAVSKIVQLGSDGQLKILRK